MYTLLFNKPTKNPFKNRKLNITTIKEIKINSKYPVLTKMSYDIITN